MYTSLSEKAKLFQYPNICGSYWRWNKRSSCPSLRGHLSESLYPRFPDMCWPTKEIPGNSVCRAVGLGNQPWRWFMWLRPPAAHFCSSHSSATGFYLCALQKTLKFRSVQHTGSKPSSQSHRHVSPLLWGRTNCMSSWCAQKQGTGETMVQKQTHVSWRLMHTSQIPLFPNWEWVHALLICVQFHRDPVSAVMACYQGDTVIVLPGTYNVSNSIFLPDSITMEGEDRDWASYKSSVLNIRVHRVIDDWLVFRQTLQSRTHGFIPLDVM